MKNQLEQMIVVLGLGALFACSIRANGENEQGTGDESTESSSGDDTSTASTSETSTTGDEGTTDSGNDDPTSQFVPESDVLLDHMCDIWNPDECPDGEKCTAYATAGSSWDANKCVPIMGDGKPGDPCTAFGPNAGVSGLDDCAEGSMCWEVDDDAKGYCIEFCSGSPNEPVCESGGLCSITQVGVLPICVLECDPLAPQGDNGCINASNLCISDPGGQGFVCVLDASGGQGEYGVECQYANSCNYGLFCANADAVPGCAGSQGCCSPYCALDQPNTCPGQNDGQECVAWWEQDPPPGYENVGGCAVK